MKNLLRQLICHRLGLKDTGCLILSLLEDDLNYSAEVLLPYGGSISRQSIEVSKEDLLSYKETRKVVCLEN